MSNQTSRLLFVFILTFLAFTIPAFSEDSKTFNEKVGIATTPRNFSNGMQVVVDPKLDVNGDIAVASDLNTSPSYFYSHYDAKATPPIYYPRFRTSIDPAGKSWGLSSYRGGGDWFEELKVQEGKLGIGTSKPTKNLTVVGSGENTAIQIKNNSKNSKRWNLISAGARSEFPEGSFVIQDETENDARFVIAPNGFIGVGTTKPEAALEMYGAGDILFRSVSDQTGGLIFQNQKGDELGKMYATTEGLKIRANNVRSEDIFIDRYTGNVGIGTASTPASKLYVKAQTEGINVSAYRALIATSQNGYGVAANGGPAGIGVSAQGRIGVQGFGSTYDFYAQGSGNNYGPFTGSHEVKLQPNVVFQKGMVVSVTGQVERRVNVDGETSLSSTLPTVKLSDQENDPAVFGVFVTESPLPPDHWYTSVKGKELYGVVNALGEGRVWVTNMNGDVNLGDYVTTSRLPGYAARQKDDTLHNYTLGKITEKIDWDEVEDSIDYANVHYKKVLAACVYTSG